MRNYLPKTLPPADGSVTRPSLQPSWLRRAGQNAACWVTQGEPENQGDAHGKGH